MLPPFRNNIPFRPLFLLFSGILLVILVCMPLSAKDGCPSTRENSYLYFSVSRYYFDQGEYEKAEEFLREAALIDGCSASLYADAAQMFLVMGKDRAADEYSKIALKIDPQEIDAMTVQVAVRSGEAITTGDKALLEECLSLCRSVIEKRPKESRLRFILVKLYLEKGDFDQCADALRTYITSEYRSRESIFLAAEVLSRAERTSSGENAAARLMEGDLVDSQTVMAIADLLWGEKEYQAAHHLLRSYLKTRNDPGILLRDATVLSEMGSHEEAIRILESADLSGNETPDALAVRARVLSRLGRMKDSVAAYEKLVALSPENEEIQIELGQLYESMNDLRNALVRFRAALDMMKARGVSSPQILVLLLRIASLSLEFEGQKTALDALSEAMKYGAGEEPLYYVIRSEVAERQSPRSALKILEEGRKITGPDIRLDIREAEIYCKTDPAKAEENIRAILEKEGFSKESFLEATGIFIRTKEFARAWKILEEGLGKYADSDMFLEAGELMERWGKYQDAERFLKKSIELNSSNASALNYLGYMLAMRGERLEEALNYVEQALKVDAHNGAFLDSLGFIYLRIGQIEHAEKNLLAAIEIFPFDPEIRDHLGDLYEAIGDHRGAVREWKHSIDYGIEGRDAVLRKIRHAESESKDHEK